MSISFSQSQSSDILNLNGKDVEEIKVAVRIRPLNQKELESKDSLSAWKAFPKHNSIVQLNPRTGKPVEDSKGKTMFSFDKVFTAEASTEDVYEFIAQDLITGVVEGRNASIFAYGQTSSGKTHTMQGKSTISKSNCGIIHYAAADLFEEVAKVEDRKYSFNVSVIEVYNEEVRDLLTKGSKKMKIREDRERGVFVNATRLKAKDLSQLIKILSAGEKNRVVAKTTLNKRSSRSHIIFSITVESTEKSNDGRPISQQQRFSNLNLIDLAGSESVRHRSIHSDERRRKEGGSINKSLLTLSLVIQALGAPASRNAHVNFRDSKLTRVLQPSLSGNSRLAFVCCATESNLYVEETKSTFLFASRIKHIKTKSRVNLLEEDEKSVLTRVNQELNTLRQTLQETVDTVKKLQGENQDLKSLVDVLTQEKLRAVKKIKILEALQEEDRVVDEIQRRTLVGETEVIPDRDDPYGGVMYERSRNLDEIVDVFIEDNEQQKEPEYAPRHNYNFESDSTLNGMPANIRANSGSNMSGVTEPTRYGSHRSTLNPRDG